LRELVAQTLQQIGNVLKTQLRIFTMKKSVLTIALATAALSLAFSGSANAARVVQGLTLNGWQLNGLTLNGWQLNGWTLNGWTLNGVRVKAVVLPGTSMKPTKLQGMELQSLKVEGGQLVGVTRVAAE
jgi:uncharacterized protein YjbI with pentapeptide repeats